MKWVPRLLPLYVNSEDLHMLSMRLSKNRFMHMHLAHLNDLLLQKRDLDSVLTAYGPMNLS